MKPRNQWRVACVALVLLWTPQAHAGWGWMDDIIAYIQAHRDQTQDRQNPGLKRAAPASTQRLPTLERDARKEPTP